MDDNFRQGLDFFERRMPSGAAYADGREDSPSPIADRSAERAKASLMLSIIHRVAALTNGGEVSR